MDASKKNIGDIINKYRILEIPFFQRPYVWGEEQWSRLLEDLEEVSQSGKPHFLGSVILKQLPTESHSGIGDRRLVVDGQQRLTTLFLFFKALFFKLDNADGFFRDWTTSDGGIPMLHNRLDRIDFERIHGLKDSNEIPDSFDSAVGKAFLWFSKKIDASRLNVGAIMSRVQFVGIDLSQEEDEQVIFDTINSLGIKLTSAELLKNYLYRREDLADYETGWMQVFELDEELRRAWDNEITAGRAKRTLIEVYLHSLLQILAEEKGIVGDERLFFMRYDRLFPAYKQLVETNRITIPELRSRLAEHAPLFRSMVNPDLLEASLKKDDADSRIVATLFGCDATTLIPYLLFIHINQPDEHLRHELFNVIESYLCRRITCRSSNNSYSTLFYINLISARILTAHDFVEYVKTRKDSELAFPSDDELCDAISEQNLTNKMARSILYLLESKTRSKHQSTALHGLTAYSLEHVMPKKWQTNWPFEGDEAAQYNRNQKLRKLGNLTILPSKLNTSLSNDSWANKVNGNNKHDGLRKLSGGIELMADFIERIDWNEAVIDERAEFLASKMLEAWPIEVRE